MILHPDPFQNKKQPNVCVYFDAAAAAVVAVAEEEK